MVLQFQFAALMWEKVFSWNSILIIVGDKSRKYCSMIKFDWHQHKKKLLNILSYKRKKFLQLHHCCEIFFLLPIKFSRFFYSFWVMLGMSCWIRNIETFLLLLTSWARFSFEIIMCENILQIRRRIVAMSSRWWKWLVSCVWHCMASRKYLKFSHSWEFTKSSITLKKLLRKF